MYMEVGYIKNGKTIQEEVDLPEGVFDEKLGRYVLEKKTETR